MRFDAVSTSFPSTSNLFVLLVHKRKINRAAQRQVGTTKFGSRKVWGRDSKRTKITLKSHDQLCPSHSSAGLSTHQRSPWKTGGKRFNLRYKISFPDIFLSPPSILVLFFWCCCFLFPFLEYLPSYTDICLLFQQQACIFHHQIMAIKQVVSSHCSRDKSSGENNQQSIERDCFVCI